MARVLLQINVCKIFQVFCYSVQRYCNVLLLLLNWLHKARSWYRDAETDFCQSRPIINIASRQTLFYGLKKIPCFGIPDDMKYRTWGRLKRQANCNFVISALSFYESKLLYLLVLTSSSLESVDISKFGLLHDHCTALCLMVKSTTSASSDNSNFGFCHLDHNQERVLHVR